MIRRVWTSGKYCSGMSAGIRRLISSVRSEKASTLGVLPAGWRRRLHPAFQNKVRSLFSAYDHFAHLRAIHRRREFQIMACQRKSRTEVGGSLNSFYSFLRVRFQSHLRRQKQVGVCLMMRTSDPASQLMQLSQPELSARLMMMVFALGISIPVS